MSTLERRLEAGYAAVLRDAADRGQKQIRGGYFDDFGGACAIGVIMRDFYHMDPALRLTVGFKEPAELVRYHVKIASMNDRGFTFREIAESLEKTPELVTA